MPHCLLLVTRNNVSFCSSFFKFVIIRSFTILYFVNFLEASSQQIFSCSNSNGNSRKRSEICSKLTITTPEWSHWSCAGVFIVNFNYILHVFVLFSMADFKQVDVCSIVMFAALHHKDFFTLNLFYNSVTK